MPEWTFYGFIKYAYSITLQSVCTSIIFNTGKFGVVYKAQYKSEEHKIIEVAVKTVKCESF